MSDIFTVVLDLSRVNNDSKSNQMFLAMADTAKMKNICDFKRYIQFLFSLDGSVELFHEDVRLPDLEDIRVLSRLDTVQVRPEIVEEKKYEGKKLISKSKGYDEKHGDGESVPMPGDSVANNNHNGSKENVCSSKSLKPGKIVPAQEVSGFGDHGKAEMSCGPSFPAVNRACNTVQRPNDNMIKNMDENKTFKLGEKNGMAENLKFAALLQNRYYGWCGKPDSNIVTGRSRFQKSNEMPDLMSGEKSCMLKSSGKHTDDDVVENKPYIPNEGGVNVARNTFKGTIWSPVKLKETNNCKLSGGEPSACRIRSKSCSRGRQDPQSGSYGCNVTPGTVQKPLSVTADHHEKNSCAEGSFLRKPLTVDEALKLLTEAATERSKTLPGNNPGFQNDGRKNQFKAVGKTLKANPAGGSQNIQKGYFKHQITSKNPATLNQYGTTVVTPDGHNPKAVSVHFYVPKQDIKKYRVNKKAESSLKNQGNAVLKDCENQSQKIGNTGQFKEETRAQNKKMCQANMPIKTEDKSHGKASEKGFEEIDGNQGRKTESTEKVEAGTGAPNPLPQCHPAKKNKSKKKKAKSENISVSHSSINDNNHDSDKVGVAEKKESKTSSLNHLVKHGNVKDKMVPGELSSSGSAFLEESLCSPAPNDIKEDFNGGENTGFEKNPSRELNSSRGDSGPGVRLACGSPDDPTGVDALSKKVSDFRFPEKDTRTNSSMDLQTTDPVNTKDEDGANVSNFITDSYWDLYLSGGTVAQYAAAYPLLGPQGKPSVRDDTIKTIVPKDDNKERSESHVSPVTNKAVNLPNIITDNTGVQCTKDNVSDNGGEGGLVSSHGQAHLTRNHYRDRFRTEDAPASTEVGTGCTRVEGTDSASSGSRSVPIFTRILNSVANRWK